MTRLKTISHLPKIPGITPKTARFLKGKSLKYLITHDKTRIITRFILKKPAKHLFRFVRSLLKRKSYLRDGDFFLYNCASVLEFEKFLKQEDALLVLGFSYCHKPFECPSKRFSSDCIHDLSHPVCKQCFIGKAINSSTHTKILPLVIPTVHYIGEKMFEIIEKNPGKKICFLITACELTLEMFGDFGAMLAVPGIGVRLDGRICNTMKAFLLSEEGIKPGLTVVLESTQERMLSILNRL